MQGAVVHMGPDGARIQRAAALPLERLFLGRPVADVAATLPQLFNLCRMAQGAAARLAVGLPALADPTAEVLRDHAARLHVTLRLAFGFAPLPVPSLTLQGLFGPMARMPRTPSELAQFQQAALPAADLLREVDALFAGRMAATSTLPLASDPLADGTFENSPGGRQADHPLLRSIAQQRGRGPMWRLMGILADAEAALTGRITPPHLQNGVAVVQASRGTYALRITQSAGLVTGLMRRTPTDHMLATGGALEQALSHLHPALAPMVLALHDPCVPVTVQEVQHA